MDHPKKMTKVVTENEIESGRISLPAAVRDHLFPDVAQNTKTSATMVDEKGYSYEVVMKVRHNRTKPEIMAKGGKKFLLKRGLVPGDVLLFSRGQSGYSFRVKVMRGQRPASPYGFARLPARETDWPFNIACVEWLTDFNIAKVKPPPRTDTELRLGAFSVLSQLPATNFSLLGQCLIGSDILSRTDTELRLGGFSDQPLASTVIGSDDIGPPPLGLGSISAQAKLPVALRLSLSIGSDEMPVENPPATTNLLELSLSNGVSYLAPPIKPAPVGRIKSEVQEEGVGPTLELELTLGLGPLPIMPTVSVSAKFVEAAEAKSEPPEALFLGVTVARLAAVKEPPAEHQL